MATVNDELKIRLVRSERRKNTISARLVGDTLTVMVPAGLTAEEEQSWVERMTKRALRSAGRTKTRSDEELIRRAKDLAERYFAGRLGEFSIRYVTNQDHRYGSCTPSQHSIRISDRLTEMPAWVLDYVIVHELAHLIEANHAKQFWRLVNRYPLTERARGFLIAKGMESAEEAPDDLE